MRYLLTLSLLFICSLAFAQDCDCDVVLDSLDTDRISLIHAADFNIQAGTKVCIPAGTYAGIRFYNFRGEPDAPITITNCGGPVVIVEEVYSAITFEGSEYVQLTGTGNTDNNYGFKLSTINPGSMGVYITNLSTDFEVDHIEVVNAGFAGIMAKSDPDCNRPETWRSSGFVMRNLDIHHNLIQNVGGEGIYVGYTGGYRTNSNFNCASNTVYGHWLENVTVSNNIVKKCGLDGIQLNLVRKNGVVRDNVVKRYGTKNIFAQNFAMSFGGGTYSVYNNKLINPKKGHGQGIQFLNGQSGSKIFNNVLVRPGLHGIFIHNRNEFDNPDLGYLVANNTIFQPERAGIHYNTVITETTDDSKLLTTQEHVPTFFVNNLIVDPGNRFEDENTWKGNTESYLDFNEIQTRNSLQPYILTNLFTRDADTLGLKNWEKNNFAPASAQSAVVDAGTDIAATGLTYDIKNKPRPKGVTYDIGAYEYNLRQVKNLDRFKNKAAKGNMASISVFPNPATHFVQFSNEFNGTATIRIFDELGYLRLRLKNYDLNQQLDVTALDRGRYYIKLNYADKSKEFCSLVLE